MQITLYGSDIDLGSNPLKSSVESLGDVLSWNVPVRVIHAQPQFESEVTKFFGGGVTAYKTVRLQLNPESLEISFPKTDISFDDFYNVPLFKKQNHYVYLHTYKINTHDSTHVTPVTINSLEFEHIDERGTKKVTMELIRG